MNTLRTDASEPATATPVQDPRKTDWLKEFPPLQRRPLSSSRFLTRDEEVALARRAQSGGREARDQMVEANLRLVVKTAHRYSGAGVPLEALIQEGVIGLIHAVEKFDPDKGFRFSTYAAFWIKQAILKAVQNLSRWIRLPHDLIKELQDLDRAQEGFAQAGQEPEDVSVLARRTQKSSSRSGCSSRHPSSRSPWTL